MASCAQRRFLGGSGGRIPLVKIVVHFGGSVPPNFLHQSCFSKRIGLASNVLYGSAMMNFPHYYMVIEIFVDVGYSISQLD